METVTTSKQFSLNAQDLLKGLLIAVLCPAVMIIQQSLDAGSLVVNWKAAGMAAVAGGLSYLVKNFLTPTQVIVKPDTSIPADTAKKVIEQAISTNNTVEKAVPSSTETEPKQ